VDGSGIGATVPRARCLLPLAVALLVAACASKSPAPVEERATRPAPKPATGVAPAPPPAMATTPAPERPLTYTVRRGDTLYKIALDHGLDYRDLAAWNSIENINLIREGQSLRVVPPGEPAPPTPGVTTMPLKTVPPPPSGEVRPPASPSAIPLVVPGPRNSENYKTQPKAIKEPYSEQALRDVQDLALASAPAASAEIPPAPAPEVVRVEPKPEPKADSAAKPESAAGPSPGEGEKIAWVWPATGKLVTGSSENPNLKGIDIAGRGGAPVVAAAPGKVVYAGTGIRGYGKLVIVKHNATWLSAYAHNREILVKEGQQVGRGQAIAEMGDTDANQVMLHFEIRRNGTPVDPLKLLPAPPAS
jgi:lipoprotein NlpD